MFDAGNGLFFRREDDGSVTIIRKKFPYKMDSDDESTQTLLPSVWAGVLATVGAKNDFQAALQFHMGEENDG